MNSDDFFSYLVATDQVDEFFGNNILKCPYCKSTLFVYEDNIMYCDNCDELIRFNGVKKINNKHLSLEKKNEIKKELE